MKKIESLTPEQIEKFPEYVKKWVSTWGAMLKKPSDLGYSDEGFALPPLNIHTRRIEIDHRDFWKEGYVALEEGRKYVGVELKKSYYEQAVRNLEHAENPKQMSIE